MASDYDTFDKKYDTIKRLYKVNTTYYYRRRLKNRLIRVSLRTKNIKVALYRKKILEMLGEKELFELKTKDYELIFEYDTEDELKQVLATVANMQQATMQQTIQHYQDVKQKVEIAEESTNPLTFGLLENQYIPNKEKRNKVTKETIGDYLTTFKLLKKYFDTKYIDEIKLIEFEEWQEWLNNGERSNRTINKYTRHLRGFIKWAIDRNELKNDNAKGLELMDEKKEKQERKKEARNYTKDEVQKILNYDYKDTTYNKIFKILAYTGMRSGELHALTNDDIKIEDNIHYFDIKDSKTIAGIRKVPISYEILDMVLDTNFPMMNCTENAYQKRLRTKLYKAIEEEKKENDTLNVHTLRGTFIENAINNNRNENMIVPIVQEVVGHTKNDKESLTLDTYMKGQELELKLNITNNIKY
ncbi:MAG: tyrosine-type recombinase/integrase [Campylobacterota bacterium]|nr:tyrosine-type recombinase/integrase [Campylobacterota bacterium]